MVEIQGSEYYFEGTYRYSDNFDIPYSHPNGYPLYVLKANRDNMGLLSTSFVLRYGSKPYLRGTMDDGRWIGLFGNEVFIENQNRPFDDWATNL